MTKVKQKTITRSPKRQEDDMNSPIKSPNYYWVPHRSQDYMKSIDDTNDAYRKMLRINKTKKVLWDQVCLMMTAKTKEEFKNTQNG